MGMAVPPILRSRLALVAMLGVLLIPIGMSSLRGLTHVLTCEDEAETPFTLLVPEDGPPAITSSVTITREDEAGACGGLFLNMRVGPGDKPNRVNVTLPITNRSEHPWQGSVELRLGGTQVPVDIGEIAAGATEEDTVEVRVDPGLHEVNGSLLIGP